MSRPCKNPGCTTEIDWAATVPGNAPMPIDRASAGKPGGNLAVWRDGGKLLCRVLKTGEKPGAGEKWGTNHWGTCTAPEEFKQPAGWSHAKRHRRWEYRSVVNGAVLDWYHDLMIQDDPVGVSESIARMGLPPLPPEARPAPEQAAL